MSYWFPVVPRLHPSRILHSPSHPHPSLLPPPLFSDSPSAALPRVPAAQTFLTPLFHHSPVCPCYCSPAMLPLVSEALCCPSFPSAADTSPHCQLGHLVMDQKPGWARKLRSSKSSERHLMIKYIIKADMVPKPKREAHTAYLILCFREIRLLV